MYKPSFTQTAADLTQSSADLHDEGLVETFGTPFKTELPHIKPSETQKSGKGTRYFAQHRSSSQILEISQKTYLALEAKDEEYDYMVYRLVSVSWDYTLPLYDEEIGKYIIEGSSTRNSRELEKVEKILPGIKDYLILKGELSI